MKRVLIGLDDSDLALRAAERAVALLGSECEFTVATVAPVPTVVETASISTPLGGMSAAAIDDTSSAAVVERARSDALAAADALGIAAKVEALVGDPGTELCRLAADGDYDVLVVGSH